MNYDFETAVDRSGMSAAKWIGMKGRNPRVPQGIVPFSVADMDLKNPPEVAEGLKDFLDDAVLGYTEPYDGYFGAVCGWMKSRHGWDASREWIVLTPGVVTALYHAVRAFTKPGDGVILMTPVYGPFYGAIRQNGRKIVEIPLRDCGGRYEIDFDSLERKAADPANTMLLFCSPHNPVGRVWTRGELEKVAEICLRNHVLVVSDEIHSDLILPGHAHTVFAGVSDEAADRCVVCTAPSKTFNLAGMQASNIFVPNGGLRARLKAELSRSGIGELNILGYKACEIAYEKCGGWLDRLLALVDGNRAFTERFLAERIPGICPCRMEGTYLQWWDCRGLGMDEQELERFLTREALFFAVPGTAFGQAGAGFERVNLACPRATLADALRRLEAAFRARK